MAKPKFDYNSNEFYDELFALAFQGLTDAEIADGLSDKFGKTLTPEVFSRMKSGVYDGWSDKQNEERSARICQALERGRRRINSIVRGAYLQTALGKTKTITKTKVYAQRKCECYGNDMNCPCCNGTGTIVSKDKMVIQEVEADTPRSLQGLATWLFNHDKEWREKTVSKIDVTTNGKDVIAPPSVNIQVVTNDPKLLELQDKSISLTEESDREN